MTATMGNTKLKLSSNPENINAVEGLIEELKDEYKICEDAYGNILVAITEAVNNAIFHGNKCNPDKSVHVSYEYLNNRIAFYIADEGNGFDYYNLPDPTSPENLDKPNGRGVFLMKHLADQIIFSDQGRLVEMHFRIS